MFFSVFSIKNFKAVSLISEAKTFAPFFDAKSEIIPEPQPSSKKDLFSNSIGLIKSSKIFVLKVK